MPELDPWLNLKRTFFAVWQEYQGLGLVGGLGFAADLIRQLILLPFALLFPASIIRYLWLFAMLVLGTLGVYFNLKKQLRFPSWISFLSSLFYLLNFGSVQNFFVPHESFSTFWGFFPWLIFAIWELLNFKHKQKTLPSPHHSWRKFIFLNLLATPSFYIPTIFIVYLLCLGCVLLSYLFVSFDDWKSKIKNLAKISIIILTINSFWLLPFVYFVKTNSQNPRQAFANFMATDITYDRNLRRGTIPDFLLLRGYYYDFDTDGNTTLMTPWHNYYSNSYFLIPGYLLSLIAIAGLFSLLVNFRQLTPTQQGLILIFSLCAIALLPLTWPLSLINSLFRQSSFLNQVFRSPFTKFIYPGIFSFTLFTAYGLQFITKLTSSLNYSPRIFSSSLIVIYSILIIIYSYPSFTGNYLSPRLRLTLEKDYSQLFQYFKSKPPDRRIATLPSGTFWGWVNYRWGYNGSGFLWYGLSQPLLDRAFDVWNPQNERYYWQLNLALQQKNPQLLSQLLNKYQIEYLIFDNNIYFPDEMVFSKQALSTSDLLAALPGLTLDQQFGLISVYHYSNPTLPYITTKINDSPDFPTYATQQPTPIISGLTPILPDWHTPPLEPQQQTVNTPDSSFYRLQNNLSHNNFSFSFSDLEFNQSYVLKVVHRHIQGHPLYLSAFAFRSRYKFFYSKMPASSDWQTSWFILPPMEPFAFSKGLTIYFDNTSYNQIETINDIKNVEIFPYPLQYNYFTPTSYQPPFRYYQKSRSNIFYSTVNLDGQLNHLNSNLVHPQSYHPGWLAFYFVGLKPVLLSGHTPANSWANAWQLPSNISHLTSTIYIVFWPQVLEFIGLLFLPILFFYLFRHHPRCQQ